MTYENLPNHCANNKCSWCTERRRRRRAQSIADIIALAKPSTTWDYWNTKTGPIEPTYSAPVFAEPSRYSENNNRVFHMHEPTNGPKRRRIWHG